ncbi:hypothetical protein GCM10022233_28190 [Streptomyces shaanxiensis]|uniref:Uncharacterized protein n=1 Tax=Streptomyces shaanxiensis TaxID=653357 RepID=A0ABP7UX90_9ACTN
MVSCPLCPGECTGITVPFVRLEKPCLDHPVPLPGGAVLPIGFPRPDLRGLVVESEERRRDCRGTKLLFS